MVPNYILETCLRTTDQATLANLDRIPVKWELNVTYLYLNEIPR